MKKGYLLIVFILLASMAAGSCGTPAQTTTPNSTPTSPPKQTLEPEPASPPQPPAPKVVNNLLEYHDRHAEAFIAAEGYGYLVNFEPPTTPYIVKKVGIGGALYGTGWQDKNFIVEIWDKNYKSIYTADYPLTKFKLDDPSLVALDIPDIEVNGDFYVHIYSGTGRNSGLHIGADDSVPNEHSDVTIKKDGGYEIANKWPYPASKWIGDKRQVNWLISVTGTYTE